MRGAQIVVVSGSGPLRIIPADAGSTVTCAPRGRVSRDHPRGCGEHTAARSKVWISRGSSPRMRGALSSAHPYYAGRRIIPADAGSTVTGPPGTICRPDHPRGCGEHSCLNPIWCFRNGSSPRMRGAQIGENPHQRLHRIIPADAGSTCWRGACCCLGWDHPRGCGEHSLFWLSLLLN